MIGAQDAGMWMNKKSSAPVMKTGCLNFTKFPTLSLEGCVSSRSAHIFGEAPADIRRGYKYDMC